MSCVEDRVRRVRIVVKRLALRREIRVKTRIAARGAAPGVRECLVARRLAGEEHRVRHRGPAVVRGENRGAGALLAVPARDGDDAVRRCDLAIGSARPELAPLGVAPDVMPGATGAEVDLADGHREALGPRLPIREMLRVRERGPDERPWRVEGSGDHELATRWRGEDRPVPRGGGGGFTWPRHRPAAPRPARG